MLSHSAPSMNRDAKSRHICICICICIYSGFDAVYHIVIIFLHMSFNVVVSLFCIIINIQCQGSWCFFLCWTQREDKKPGGCRVPPRWFAMVSGHLLVNNVGCWAFSTFHLCSGAVGAMRWVYWAQSPDVEGLLLHHHSRSDKPFVSLQNILHG
jgi:hypothetical protein